ncbi:MAG: V-type ATP synthase subunit C [Bacillota bacterium]
MPIDDTAYAYAVGRIRALEARLLDQNRFDRMIDASSAEEVLKMLTESEYASSFGELSNIHDFETILSSELRHIFDLLETITPWPELIAIMALRYDVHNLKVLFKARYLDIKSNLLIPVGTCPTGKMVQAVAEDDFRDLPDRLRIAAEKVNEDFLVNHDPQVIDLILDQALFEELISRAEKANVPFLKGLFIRQIDLINLKTLVRVKNMGFGREFFKKAFLPNGNLSFDQLGGSIDEPLESLIVQLGMTEYATLVDEGIRDWLDRGTASRFEKLADDYITAYLKKGKWMPFGPEPLIGYLWAKEVELKNIRLILVGKINKLPAEAIRERIRDAYI